MHRSISRSLMAESLTLYSRHQLNSRDVDAPSPFAEPLNASPHLRWHPLRGEWVTYAAYRQGRTFLPPPEYNPLGCDHWTRRIRPNSRTETGMSPFSITAFPSLGGSDHGSRRPR